MSTIPALKYWCKTPVSVRWGSSGRWRDVQIWLLDNVPKYENYEFTGMDPENPENRIIWFANEKDAALFALTWV